MIRWCLTTFGFVAFRIAAGVTTALGLETLIERPGVTAWSGWAIPFLLTGMILRGRKMRGRARRVTPLRG